MAAEMTKAMEDHVLTGAVANWRARGVDVGFSPPRGRAITVEAATACREQWPDCRIFDYHPSCCRFPKSCSAPPLPPCDDPTVIPLR